MSVEPWIEAWPRSARIPPPGRPMLPSRSWRIAAVRMYCTPDSLLCPADRVAERAGPLASGVVGQGARHLFQQRPRHPADLLHRLRGVAGEVALEDLEDTARVGEGQVDARMPLPFERRAHGAVVVGVVRRLLPLAGGGRHPHPLVLPARRVVPAGVRVPAGEQTVTVVLGVHVALVDSGSDPSSRRTSTSRPLATQRPLDPQRIPRERPAKPPRPVPRTGSAGSGWAGGQRGEPRRRAKRPGTDSLVSPRRSASWRSRRRSSSDRLAGISTLSSTSRSPR